MSDPYLSAFCIVGDSGLGTLAAALKSITHRTGGPLYDELVLGWNGTNEAAFLQALSDGLGVSPTRQYADGELHTVLPLGVQLKVVRFDWPGRFDTARNLTMRHCRGEWCLWIDSDDRVADAGTPEGQAAIEAVERAYNIPPPQGAHSTNSTLKDWLKGLPFGVNCILAPYDYAVLQDGSVTIRQTMKRILRRSVNWVWRSFSGIHELPYPAMSVGEASLFTPGLLNRHFPKVEAVDRLKRNADVINAMQQPDIVKHADARHHYDVASVAISSADFATAEKSISDAIRMCCNDVDLYRYLLIRYSIVATVGRLADALIDALRATGVFPERGEAYFAAAEGYYLMGKYRACIKNYEIGAACPVNPVDLDLCVNRIVRPRANASWAYCELGEPERGLHIAAEALREYPNDELAKRAYNRCATDTMRRRAIDGMHDAVQYLFAQNELEAASGIVEMLRSAVTLRAVQRDPRFIAASSRLRQRWEAVGRPSSETVSVDAGVATIRRVYPAGHPPVDALVLSQPPYQLLGLTAEPNGAQTAILRETTKPSIAFIGHGNSMPWNPTYPETVGLGGSETSFIMLARELSKRGYPVRLYCNDGGHGAQLDNGVVWMGLNAFDETEMTGVVVSCRSPWVVRNPNMRAPVYCWHQDNGYCNAWSWSPEVEQKLRGNLYVSEWAMQGLLKELGSSSTHERHHVIGNPILADWVLEQQPRDARPERKAHRVIYASDPMRGLDTLLNVWPIVTQAIPDAELHVYSDFGLIARMFGLGTEFELPVAREAVEGLQRKLNTTGRVVSHGRVAQTRLSHDMMSAGVYAYPGCAMPEGFGVVLAQAAAAGMQMLVPNEGALPEVLHGATLARPMKTDIDAGDFAQTLIGLLQTAPSDEQRLTLSRVMWERHGVDKVADRFEAVLKKDRLA